MKSKLSRRLICSGCVVLVLIGAVFVLDKVLPYSQEHFRDIEAVRLRNDVRAYEANMTNAAALQTLLRSNAHSALFRFETNLNLSGVRYETVLGVTNSSFRGKGMLAGCRGGHVFWIRRNGDVEKLK